MTYQVLQNLLREEIQDRVPIRPARLVVHSTANPGASDEAHFNWLDAARRHGWTHYYLDWDSIRQFVAEGFRAPAQGPTSNEFSFSFELCEPPTGVPWDEQVRLFGEVWARGVWLAADILHRWGWGIDRMDSHAMISERYPDETNHTDPLPFFARYGRTWNDFVAAVQAALDQRTALPPAQPWQEEFITQLMAEGLLHQRRHPMEPMEWWEGAALALRVLRAAREPAATAVSENGNPAAP